jgi:hypothetical protein
MEKDEVIRAIKNRSIFDVSKTMVGREPKNYKVDALVINGHEKFALIYFDDLNEAKKMCLHHITSNRVVEWHHFELSTFCGKDNVDQYNGLYHSYKIRNCHTVKRFTKVKPITWNINGFINYWFE